MEGHSCADLELVINEAGITAGYENKKFISQEDIKKAMINRIFGGCELGEDNPESDRRLAVHEAGHAVLSEENSRKEVEKAQDRRGCFCRQGMNIQKGL